MLKSTSKEGSSLGNMSSISAAVSLAHTPTHASGTGQDNTDAHDAYISSSKHSCATAVVTLRTALELRST